MKATFFVVILVLLVVPVFVRAADFKACIDCHSSLQTDTQKQFIHSPFSDGLCEECHAIDAEIFNPEDNKIDWLGEGRTPSKTHAFRFPDDELGEVLVVETKYSSAPPRRDEIPIPSLYKVQYLEDPQKTPIISNPRLLSLNQGIFLTANIGWETDLLTEAFVFYGENDLSNTASEDKRYGTEHLITLKGLMPDRTYHFVAVAHDLFGRKSESEPVTFSTVMDSTQALSDKTEIAEEIDGVKALFSRVEEDFLIEIQLPQAYPVFVGTKGRKQPCLPEDEYHEGVSCLEVSLMAPCLNCHEPHDHPVGIAPQKRGIRIPEEFPTLPGGRVACASCHNAHSSKHPQLTRKDSRKALCGSCHRKWIK